MNILSPEKNLNLLKYYHKSNKLLIPGIGLSILMHSKYFEHYKNRENKINTLINVIDLGNVLNFGYHSYVSTSAVITDYIKFKNLSKISRIVNFKLHSLATIGISYYLINKNNKLKSN